MTWPVQAIQRARELHAATWPVDRIRHLIAREFDRPAPCWHTVKAWVDFDHAEHRRDLSARNQARLMRRRNGPPTVVMPNLRPETKTLVLEELRAAGLDETALIAVRRIVFREPVVQGGRMTVAVPQRDQALQLANEIRLRNAETRRTIRAVEDYRGSLLKAAELVEAGECESIPLERLLLACRRVGATRARRWVREIGVLGVNRRVRDLTPRQRRLLCEVLRAG